MNLMCAQQVERTTVLECLWIDHIFNSPHPKLQNGRLADQLLCCCIVLLVTEKITAEQRFFLLGLQMFG